MNNSQKAAVLLQLVGELEERGSWCGETHIQKATYFLRSLLRVPLELEFSLYKHGPYSFELRHMLTDLRADGLLELVPQPYPYGPSYRTANISQEYREHYPNTLSAHRDAIRFVAETLGGKRVTELEQLSTALLVSLEMGHDAPPDSRAKLICELKPHISRDDSLSAVELVDEIVGSIPSN